MKNLIVLAVAAAIAFNATAASANLYKKGTALHGYVDSLSDFMPKNLEVVFVNHTDRTQFIQDLEPDVFDDNLPLQKMIEKAYETPKAKGHMTYSNILLGKDFDSKQDTCTVFAPDIERINKSYMHEIMHCIAISSAERYDMAKALIPVMKDSFTASNGTELTIQVKTNRVLEVHAHILADVIMNKTGLTADRAGQEGRAVADYPRSVGKLSTARGTELCRADSCPADASELMQQLMADDQFVEALRADFTTVAEFMEKTGGHWR